uniref:Glutathione hydrolase 5 proenzyme-like n=1 Tax=Diabrotica virgifera virgifera TaxID=50390 RepID=A0A6P7FM53_DIAVI
MSDTAVTREDIPLKKGKINRKWYTCGDEDCISGSKYVNIAFGTLTAIITLALIIQINYGDYQVVPHGSVASDSFECSKIGTSTLIDGNAIDAAIATAFCLSVTTPHLTGLDAEGQILIYNHRKKNPPLVINFSHKLLQSKDIPTSVLGLAYVHRKFGKLPWKNLVLPAANLASVELHSLLRNFNETALTETVKVTKFKNFEIYVPQNDESVGQFLVDALNELEKMNLNDAVFADPSYAHELVDVIQYYQHENTTYNLFHEGTISDVAVMDAEDNYVSLVTGMYQFFGSGKRSPDGYLQDKKDQDTMNSRMPVLILDGWYICGRRYVFSANNLGSALQIISNLLLHKENVTDAIEAPRLYIGNWTVGFEASHRPYFPKEITEHSPWKFNIIPEPYQSINIVFKNKDELSSHSDSRGGGIASRF